MLSSVITVKGKWTDSFLLKAILKGKYFPLNRSGKILSHFFLICSLASKIFFYKGDRSGLLEVQFNIQALTKKQLHYV